MFSSEYARGMAYVSAIELHGNSGNKITSHYRGSRDIHRGGFP